MDEGKVLRHWGGIPHGVHLANSTGLRAFQFAEIERLRITEVVGVDRERFEFSASDAIRCHGMGVRL